MYVLYSTLCQKGLYLPLLSTDEFSLIVTTLSSYGYKHGSSCIDRKWASQKKEANGKILFLDKIQDLPTSVQSKLVGVLQDNDHSFRPVGRNIDQKSDLELVGLRKQQQSKNDFFDHVVSKLAARCLDSATSCIRNCNMQLILNGYLPVQFHHV